MILEVSNHRLTLKETDASKPKPRLAALLMTAVSAGSAAGGALDYARVAEFWRPARFELRMPGLPTGQPEAPEQAPAIFNIRSSLTFVSGSVGTSGTASGFTVSGVVRPG